MRNVNTTTTALPTSGITGVPRIYKRFNDSEDIIIDQTFVNTKGLWSGNVGDLYTFYTSSAQTATQKTYYYAIYQSQSSACGAEEQFSVTWGHRLGSGSVSDGGQIDDTPSRAMYSQLRLLCLDPDDTTFSFKSGSTSVDSDNIYAIVMNRSRMEDKLDPGNFELSLARYDTGSGATDTTSAVTIQLIDDSGDSDDSHTYAELTSPVYNLVSGSISNGIYDSTKNDSWGLVYPDLGIIVLNGDKLDSQLNFGTELASNTAGNNALRLFHAISGSGAPTAERPSTTFPFSARSSEKVTTSYYFCRVMNPAFNFSNNPTWVSGSEGRIAQSGFEKNPRVYITAVGLYNDDYELLAVGKLSQPYQKSFTTETLITVKLEY